MKARVKATGEIIEVTKDYDLREPTLVEFYTNVEDPTDVFEKEDLEFSYDSEFIDYWARLEHQYAGMAMQGMLNNSLLITGLLKVNKSHEDIVAEVTGTAIRYAHALVEKYKNEE